jgi:alpha-1,2-mannosyltransferase
MKIVVCHLSLNFLGGEEKLCLSFIDALKRNKHNVTLFTLEKTDWKAVQKMFGNFTQPDVEVHMSSFLVYNKFSKLAIPLLSYLAYFKGLVALVSRGKYDVVINTYGDMFTSIADLSYVHFPITATLDYGQIPAFASPTLWKAYSQAFKIWDFFASQIRPSVLLTNSKFTWQVVKKLLKRNAIILHPPVAVKDYLNGNTQRKNYVITVSKFTPKRHLHKIPLIARKAKNARFIIAGVADEYSIETLQKLRGMIRFYGVEGRVSLMPNVPRSTLISLLRNAKAYLHTMPFEHFGMSIIEAMAAGCVPIVHRSGGPWLDILNEQQGVYGFSYESIEEAAQTIDFIMDKEDVWRKISENAQKRATYYDETVFEKKLTAIIESFARTIRGTIKLKQFSNYI